MPGDEETGASELSAAKLASAIKLRDLRSASEYFAWREDTRFAFMAAGLLGAIDKNGKPAIKEGSPEWLCAFGLMARSLSVDVRALVNVHNLNDSPRLLWSTLESKFDKPTLGYKLQLATNWLELQFNSPGATGGEDDNETMLHYVARAQAVYGAMIKTGIKMEELHMGVLLKGLPSRYSTAAAMIEGQKDLTIDSLAQQLQTLEARFKIDDQRENENDRPVAMLAKTAFKCFHCGKAGHVKRDCPARPARLPRCAVCNRIGHTANQCNAPGSANPISPGETHVQAHTAYADAGWPVPPVNEPPASFVPATPGGERYTVGY